MKVSVIMPSNRPVMLRRAVDMFLRQDWEDKELIIATTTDNECAAGSVKNIRNVNFQNGNHAPLGMISTLGKTIGELRNAACGAARGLVIMHFDDDDYYAPDYISRSVNHLIATGADTTGLSSAYFYQKAVYFSQSRPHKVDEAAWEYTYTGTQPYVIGSGMCYFRHKWETNHFKAVNEGEDTTFCANAGRVIPHNYKEGFVAMIHGQNTASHKQLRHMKHIDPNIVRNILEKW